MSFMEVRMTQLSPHPGPHSNMSAVPELAIGMPGALFLLRHVVGIMRIVL